MAPARQDLIWSDILCCIACNQLFDNSRAPVNLTCGHVVCLHCIPKIIGNRCPEDQNEGTYPLESYPVNAPLLSILSEDVGDCLPLWDVENVPKSVLSSIETALVAIARYLQRAQLENGSTGFNKVLSRNLQRKLVSLICFQVVEEEGRLRILKTSRLIAERIMMELLLSQQNSGRISTQLWTAVRARGCQFLGPAMQEDILKLILFVLGKGALIARKALVMHVVQMLSEGYPQVSKTCVGHVVQLLYRASCFNVLKREGESSLMQLKDEFRNYESLRKEHDAQIVQMALDCGLRISPDQWSVLLYGDQSHRSHMQSLIDRLQTPRSYMQGVEELTSFANERDLLDTGCVLTQIAQLLRLFDPLSVHSERVSWSRFAEYINDLYKLIKLHSELVTKRNEQRGCDAQRTASLRCPAHLNSAIIDKACAYKTKMCRDISARRLCPRGARCTYAHSTEELRDGSRMNVTSCSRQSNNGHLLTKQQVVVPVPSAIYPTGLNGAYHSDSSLTSIPPPSPSHPTIVPIVPVPLMISSPAHHSVSQLPSNNGSPQMIMLPPGISHQGMVLSSPAPYPRPGIFHSSPQPSSLWSTHPPQPPGAMLVHHVNSPSNQPHHQIWIHTSPTVYAFDAVSDNGFVWSGPCRPELTMPPPSVQPSRLGDQPLDTDQLMMKRNEIINRLVPLKLLDEDDFEDGGVGHVSYTVASSVLDDRGELHPVALMVGPQALELPPIPAASLSTVHLPTTVADGTVTVIGDMALSTGPRPHAPSVPLVQVNASHTTLLSSESAPSATVQSDCAAMQIKDSLSQPLPTPALQRSQVVAPVQVCAVPVTFDTGIMSERIGTVIRPVTLAHPQDMISSSLDKIVDVKERLNEADGVSSTAVNQHLLLELRIAEREMDLLDRRTQASCLLRELHHVDRQIEEIEAFRPVENC